MSLIYYSAPIRWEELVFLEARGSREMCGRREGRMEEVGKEERLRLLEVGCGWIGFLEWRYSVPMQVLDPNGGSQSQGRFSI